MFKINKVRRDTMSRENCLVIFSFKDYIYLTQQLIINF